MLGSFGRDRIRNAWRTHSAIPAMQWNLPLKVWLVLRFERPPNILPLGVRKEMTVWISGWLKAMI